MTWKSAQECGLGINSDLVVAPASRCPRAEPYTPLHQAVKRTMRHIPFARRFGVWGDDTMGYGKPDDSKKRWFDHE